jgi:hypothetical protein
VSRRSPRSEPWTRVGSLPDFGGSTSDPGVADLADHPQHTGKFQDWDLLGTESPQGPFLLLLEL